MLIGRGKQLIEPRKNFTIRLSDEEREQAEHDARVSDGKLMETQTANYFSDIYPIDCAVLSANA